ncbi:TetR/AcrR family transcriptional regulator [Lactiplantibacillus garii]|uniref:TetR/AcrR family transcriptional regulator n=1 Tax=Lactiplantibacillus garii TaxID=2306423 RepID=A0A3R8J4X1_9LACO|nr:TetR/AcrR family transcriptional regulator [Lactiplantibacillus garii]RRK09205.1 TetR/AcrR family transcriptional regulator [Lactiplantibacillus garii]
MYHIKKDKRAKKSAKLIIAAMDTCLVGQDFEELTITEICQVSTVSRATFYRLFDSLQDVIDYKCELFAENFSKTVRGTTSLKDLQIAFFTEWMSNIKLFKLVVSLKRTDIIYECHRKQLVEIGNGFVNYGSDITLSDHHIAILTSTMIGTLLVWYNHGCQESPQQLVTSLNQVLRDITSIFG